MPLNLTKAAENHKSYKIFTAPQKCRTKELIIAWFIFGNISTSIAFLFMCFLCIHSCDKHFEKISSSIHHWIIRLIAEFHALKCLIFSMLIYSAPAWGLNKVKPSQECVNSCPKKSMTLNSKIKTYLFHEGRIKDAGSDSGFYHIFYLFCTRVCLRRNLLEVSINKYVDSLKMYSEWLSGILIALIGEFLWKQWRKNKHNPSC